MKAQQLPNTFLIGEEIKLNKTSEETPASNSISDIIIHNDTIWLGTSRGVSLSTDNGNNWINFYGSDAFGTESISAIAYDSVNNAFWAATAHSVERDGNSLPEGSGLRYTTNFGNTWNSVSQSLDSENDTIVEYGINRIRTLPVTVAIQNLTYDIGITPNTIWTASFAGGLRKSTDKGVTWQRVVLPPDNLNTINPNDTLDFCLSPVGGNFCSSGNLNHRVFSISTANDSTIYVGTAGGINLSTDGGISWSKFNHDNQDNPISGNFVVALNYNKNNNTVWAATWRAEGASEFYGVSSSANNGTDWQTFLEGEKAHNIGFKQNEVIAPSDNGAFRSSNQGISWITPTAIVDNFTKISLRTNIFYAANSSGNNVWLGSADGLVRLTETGFWTGVWKVYFASQPLKSTSDTYAYPNPFSPKLDILKIKYSTGGNQTSVTIRIFDFGMNYIRTVIQNVQRGNPVHSVEGTGSSSEGVIDYWDGKDDAGNTVPNGVYFYRIDAGSNEPVYGKILVVQ